MVERLTQLKKTQDRAAGLARCSEMCLRLASGKYDALSGRYLTLEDDFDKLLQHDSERV